MSKKIIAGENVEGLPISEAVIAGDFVFISGMVGFDSTGKIVEGGVVAETKCIMEELQDLLAKAGATLNDVVKTNVYLTDPKFFNDFNETYASFFDKNFPARVGVVTSLTIDAVVEMDFVAYLGS